MIGSETFIFKHQNREKGKNNERDNFLNDFELPNTKRSAVSFKSNFIGRNHRHIFKQRNHPAKKNDFQKAQICKPIVLLEFQVTVPSKRHKYVGNNQ